MADNEQKTSGSGGSGQPQNGGGGNNFGDKVSKAASAGVQAVKAAAKAAAGDVAGAVVEVLKSEYLRNGIIAILLSLVLLITLPFMLLGSSILGVVHDFAAAWEVEWEDTAASSGGNALYLYTIGVLQTGAESLERLFETDNHTVGGVADNTAEGENSSFTKNDYQTTIQAVTQQEALVGENGAVMRRIEMIQQRVRKRGQQILQQAHNQYSREAIGIALGVALHEAMAHPLLYGGVSSFNVNLDTTAFELPDLQAIKILSAYSIQHDCDLGNVDMWDLMDYCGFYSVGISHLQQAEPPYEQTIYKNGDTEILLDPVMQTDLSNTDPNTINVPFLPLLVPRWYGTFVPQWALEERVQIYRHNKKANELLNAIEGGTWKDLDPEDRHWGSIKLWLQTTEDNIYSLTEEQAVGKDSRTGFEKLDEVKSCGIIDLIYTSNLAVMSCERKYAKAEDIDQGIWEQLKNNTGAAKLWNLWNNWRDSKVPKSTTDDGGNIIARDKNGNHSYTLEKIYLNDTFTHLDETCWYYLVSVEDNQRVTEKNKISPSVGNIKFTNLKSSTTYQVYQESSDGKIVTGQVFRTHTNKSQYGNDAYTLEIDINISFGCRTVDDLIYNVIGLWPGNLKNTVIGTDGKEYPDGHDGNPMLLKTWTDTYKDPDGARQTVTFQRLQGYQDAAFRDDVVALAALLGYDTEFIYPEDYGYGNAILSVALSEWQINAGITGGMRYKEAFRIHAPNGYTLSASTAWCACFVYYCAWVCGYTEPGGCFGENWELGVAGCWGAIQGEKYTSRDYRPSPGDIIFWGREIGGRFAHIGIVERVTPDGKLNTIEGNSGNTVRRNGVDGDGSAYPSYTVGTYCWNDDSGIPVYINGYIRPNYPASFSASLAYLTSASGVITPKRSCQVISTTEETPIVLAGTPRFRWSQLQAVVDELRSKHPSLYMEQMQEALDKQDTSAFRNAWNKVVTNNGNAFQAAQMEIAQRLFVTPTANKAQAQNGFNWTRTKLRQEILWAVATATDDLDTAAVILSKISGELNDAATDDALLLTISNGRLEQLISNYSELIWAKDLPSMQKVWIASFKQLALTLEERYTNQGGTYGIS